MKVQREILLRPLRANVCVVPARTANLLPKTQRRSLIPAPSANSGPLLDRRADRELPKVESRFKWARTLPIFAVLTGAAVLGIFNYQKSSSSVVSSTLYALRVSPQAREILGDEIYFANQIPWISGQMDQLHGRINISYWVKGTKAKAKMTFKSVRPDRLSYFHTEEWSLETEDGKLIQLLAPDQDPFRTP
ncbi:uncharacterized protein TRUGW13939_03514 [Talaromyces rugulosus]|uniref:DUF1783-domain-containing protein n=1 Tax=Talaromyces rugulosus TaxID=121627 RepID=A0A7H8QRB0_TALRU|nr:uncharacterized protein TRUGW13939_03514 [Talaromyces rugulosus]QKX56409.1 hypothetical protein TRUGW13939_03514 [Talaromyces rugulosus]